MSLTDLLRSFKAPAAVKIRVGDSEKYQDFVAHESFLTSRSEFFRLALKKEWKEAESRLVKLPDDDPYIFAIYLNVVYTGHVNTVRMPQEEVKALDEHTFRVHLANEYRDLLHLYILAEKLQDIEAKNAAITAVVEVAQVTSGEGTWMAPGLSVADIVYEGTPEGSPLRRLLIELFSGLPVSYILCEVHKREYHTDFIKDIAAKLDDNRQLKKGYRGKLGLKETLQNYLEGV